MLDLGCGVGGALLAAACRRPSSQFVGLERDPGAVQLARQNVDLNAMADRVRIVEGDVTGRFSELGLGPFDAVMANPPFFDDPGALRGPAPEKAAAWLADGGLAAWIAYMFKAVRQNGRLTIIHRADRLADLLNLLSHKAGSIQILPIAPFADAPAKRVVVRAIKSGRAPLVLRPALVLHERDGVDKHTVEVEAILRGKSDLSWL